MHKVYKDISLDFERAIRQMQNDLQYLADKGNVSKRFIKKQNQILKTLISYYNHTQEQIEFSRSELRQTQIANNRHREKLTNRIIQFEAVCIMHGIMDFPRFIALPKFILVDWAERLHKEKRFLYSDMLKDFIADLPPEKGKLLESILYERVHEEIKALLKGVKNSKILKNGTRI